MTVHVFFQSKIVLKQNCAWFDYVPVNIFSVMSGQVFLGLTSTKQRIVSCSRTQCKASGEAQTHDPESCTLQLSHHATLKQNENFHQCKFMRWHKCQGLYWGFFIYQHLLKELTYVLQEGRNVMKNQALTKTTFIQNNRRSIPRPIDGLIFSTCYLFNIIHNLLM